MKLSQHALISALALSFGLTASVPSRADEPVKEAVEKVKTVTKKGMRAVKDEACPLVDGKVQCAAKKAKHKVENATEKN